MEESIKRAEKLVHATNSALAQMKYNLTFDNGYRERGHSQVPDRRKWSFSVEEDLNQFEQDFRAEANEMLLKMDKLLNPNQFYSTR